MYVGIHYPTDVIAGALVATIFAFPAYFIGSKIYDALAKKFKKRKKAK